MTPNLRSRSPLPTQVSIAELPLRELAEFIEPAELLNAPLAGLDIADYEPERDG